MFSILLHLGLAEIWMIFFVQPLMYCIRSSDVRYVSIYQNIDICIQYRDTILAFGCIDTLEWAV